MRCLIRIFLGLLTGVPLGFAPAAEQGPPDQVYAVIAARNVFGLKPILPQPQALPPQPALPKIILTGITTILGNKRVLLKVQTPARPPEPASELSLILTEGQRDGVVEILEIDEKDGSVRLINSGTEMRLSLDKDGPTAFNAAGPTVAAVTASGNFPPPGTRPIGLDPRVTRRVAPARNSKGIQNQPGITSGPSPLPPPPSPDAGQAPPLTTEQAILTELEREMNPKQ